MAIGDDLFLDDFLTGGDQGFDFGQFQDPFGFGGFNSFDPTFGMSGFDPGGGLGEFGSTQMVYDTQTGETISLQEAFNRDAQAAQEFIGPMMPPGMNQGGTSPNMLGISGLTNAQLAGLGIGGLTAGVGLIGVLQKAMQGDQTARQEVSRIVGTGTSEERAALRGAFQQFQTLQQFATGSPAGLMQQLGANAPPAQAALAQGTAGLGSLATQAGGLTQSLLPQLTGAPGGTTGLTGALGGQDQILNLLTQAASGNLPPELTRLVEQAFQPQLGNIATQAIEAARQRGFAGGAELLNQAPAGALAGPALSDLQGQMAQAKLGLIPMLGQAAGAYSTPAALRMSGTSNLMNLNQSILQALMGAGGQSIQNQLGFMGALTGAGSAQGGLANQGRLGGGTTTQTTSTPSTLLDAFAPLAGLLGGAGGLLGGIGAMNRPATTLNLSGATL